MLDHLAEIGGKLFLQRLLCLTERQHQERGHHQILQLDVAKDGVITHVEHFGRSLDSLELLQNLRIFGRVLGRVETGGLCKYLLVPETNNIYLPTNL